MSDSYKVSGMSNVTCNSLGENDVAAMHLI